MRMKLYDHFKSKIAFCIVNIPMLFVFIAPFFVLKPSSAFVTGVLGFAIYFLCLFVNADYFDDLELDDDAVMPYIRPIFIFTFLSCFVTLGPALILSYLGWI